jgi:hypothetical protein
MDKLSAFFSIISNASPLVLVAMVSVVALLVVAECVRQVCKAVSKGKE